MPNEPPISAGPSPARTASRTADSTANVLRTIKAQVTDLAGAFGKGLEPVLNRVGISLRDKFADPQTKQRVEELGKLVGEKLQNALRKIGDWFRQHWGGIKEGFRTTGRVLRDLAKAAEGFYAVLKKIGSITPGGTSTVIGLIVGGYFGIGDSGREDHVGHLLTVR